jgi:hypothetical protein
VFNYINYARMEVVHQLNPYTTIPILEPHNDPAFALSNWHELLSPYGPLFTLFTFIVVPLGVPASFWVLKLALGLASLAVIALVWRCARLLGRDPLPAVTFVGLNPIVLVWGLGGDHNDFLMMLFIVLGFYLLLVARARDAGGSSPRHDWLALLYGEFGAGAAFVTAVAIKASAAVLLPVVLVSMLHKRLSVLLTLSGMIVTGAVVALASLLAFGLHIPDLSTQGSLVTSESIPNLIGLAVGAGGENETVRAGMIGLLGAALAVSCWIAWRRRDAITAAGWASVALLLTLSWVLPWYVLWVLPLAALSTSRRLRTATLALGVYLILVWVPVSSSLQGAVGFHPQRTTLARLHQRYVKELLN